MTLRLEPALSGEGGRTLKAANAVAGAATQGELVKNSQLLKKLERANGSQTRGFKPHWRFCPIGFDSFGALGSSTRKELKRIIPRISQRTHTTISSATQAVYNSLSYAIWTSAAILIISRQPMEGITQAAPLERVADIY